MEVDMDVTVMAAVDMEELEVEEASGMVTEY